MSTTTSSQQEDSEEPTLSTTTTTTPLPDLPLIPPKKKVKVHFVAVGSAPLMKKTKFQISSEQRFVSVLGFLRKMLKISSSSSLFLYVNSAFVPSPDELVGDLNDCFALRGELIIHYSIQEAWG